MSTRRQREMLRLERMAFDDAVEAERNARESVLTEEEVAELTPKKKPAKSKNKASQKETK